MKFMHNDWVQHDIINNIIILTKWGAYMIYNVIPMKYHNYSSTTILKYANVLAKVNNSSYKRLLDMMPWILQDWNTCMYNDHRGH